MNRQILETTEYLFGCQFDDPSFEANDSYERHDAAKALIDQYGWEDVYPCWFDYLQKRCPTDEDVVNFANLFYYYAVGVAAPKDPYSLISFLYYRVDTSKNEDAAHIFDSIAISLLSESVDRDLEKEPYYAAENDPKVLAYIEEWKKREKKD